MQYKIFKDGIKLSRLGMGVMRLPVKGDQSEIDYKKAKAVIDMAMEKGINYYDTAYVYHGGNSEAFLGKIMKGYPRDSFYVADKFNFRANPDYKKQFEEQLTRLQMDRIDFYLLHGIQDAFADDILKCGCVEYFDHLKKTGRIRYLGFSFHGSPEMLKKVLAYYNWDFVQMQLNYYDWYCGNAEELYNILASADVPVMVMEPVHGGLLANLISEAAAGLKEMSPERSVASWAMRWVLGRSQVQVVLSGMSSLSQITDNAKTFSECTVLTEKEEAAVQNAAQIQCQSVTAACTECRYCTPYCPQELDIPKLLQIYNEEKIGGIWQLKNSLAALPENTGPDQCIGCAACTEHCPQDLDIPGYLIEMCEMQKQ